MEFYNGIPVVSVKTMRESDKRTIESGVSSVELMRRAGEAIFMSNQWKAPVAVVCGKGNNAGDGFVLALYLHENGVPCDVFLVSDSFSDEGQFYFKQLQKRNISVHQFSDDIEFRKYESIADCIFGTGFHGKPAGEYERAIHAINSSKAYVVSADISSGINGDTGTGEIFVNSNLTVAIGAYKQGQFMNEGAIACGKLVCVDIGIDIIDTEN